MKKRMTFAGMFVLAVLILTCLRSTKAQFGDGDVDGRDFLIWQSSLGIVPSQMIRITVASAITPGSIIETGADQSGVRPLSFQCSVFDQNGVRVFQTARREVPLQGFRSENILFGDLAAVPGDPVTLRKQVRVVVSYFTSAGSQQSNFGSVEIIDPTGKTTTSQGWGPWEVSLTPVLRGGGA